MWEWSADDGGWCSRPRAAGPASGREGHEEVPGQQQWYRCAKPGQCIYAVHVHVRAGAADARASCGDELVQPGEECDDGNVDNTDACLSTCKTASCGDMTVQAGVEECDDGNVVDTDACTATCQTAECGDASVQEGVEDNLCLQTNNETSCGNPMLKMSQFLCSQSPDKCPQLYDTYQYMGNKWTNMSACGAKAGNWCVQGSVENNQDALCVKP